MTIVRLASSTLVAIVAMGLAVASVASAAPEIKPTGSAVTATGGTATLEAEGEKVVCASNVVSGGVVTSATLIGGITVHFLECTDKTASNVLCPAMSTGASLENLIITKTLHGVLGLILPKPASGSDVALVLLPVASASFVTILGTCFPTTNVAGSVAGLVNPVGVSTTKGTLTVSAPGGVQAIKDVDLSTGGLVLPKLTAFGGNASEETTELVTYSVATEVT
jgi:hypothetical protein